ncbi:MAG: plastocyanin/azurin family copper-binding protein [Gemmatimonadaceae bacterium]
MRFIGRSAILLAAIACGGSSSTAPPQTPSSPSPSSATVNATPSIAFSPATTTIALGGTVTFAFGSVPHNVYFDATTGAPQNIPGNNANTSASVTFNTPGTYVYHCHIHPGMTGTVIVGATMQTNSGGYGYL